jgi:hypothetical protein
VNDFARIGKAVYCAGGHAVARIDYSKPGHPRRVHEDETLCDHDGQVRIGERATGGDAT